MTTDDLGFLDRSEASPDALAQAFLEHVEHGLGSYDAEPGALRVYAMAQVMVAYFGTAAWMQERDRRHK